HVESTQSKNVGAGVSGGLAPRGRYRNRAGDHEDLRARRFGEVEDGAADEPRKIGLRSMEIVENEENGHVRELVDQESGQDARFRLVSLLQEVRETTPAETGEERGEIPQERGTRRALMNLKPIDVRPRPLTDEPAGDDRALSNA